MEGRKEKPVKINWQKLEIEAWKYEMAHVSTPESELLRIQESVTGQIDAYIRSGGLDRDIAELDSMFVDVDLDERINAIGGTLWISGGDPAAMGRTGGRYGHRLELGLRTDTADKPGGIATIKAWWVPESREAWISSTASGKVFVGSIVAKLANRENHTVMDTLRQGLYLRLLRAEQDMRARRDASSVRRRIEGEIPEGLRSYIAWCRDRKEE